MEKIKSVKEAERKFAKWKREHPEEWSDILLHEEPRWTYLDWKHFMESKGFTFAMSDEEFVKRCEWLDMTIWEKLKASWKKKLTPEKKIKEYRYIAIVHACFALFSLGMAFFNFYVLVQLYRASQIPAIEDILKTWKSIIFLSSASAISGTFAVIGLLMLAFALYFYSFSLELRIKQLETKYAIFDDWMKETEETAKRLEEEEERKKEQESEE